MHDIDFSKIAARSGGQREAFEELCCQIAQLTLKAEARFVRLRGAGGDGGVECFSEDPTGAKTGWQAKYVFDFEGLLTQLTGSLNTALTIHMTLETYVVCFPFDLTGPTGRKGKSELEKFAEWKSANETAAASSRQTSYNRSIYRIDYPQ